MKQVFLESGINKVNLSDKNNEICFQMEMEGEEKSWILVHVTNHTLQKQLQTGTTKLPKEWTPPFLRADFNIALIGLSQKKYMGYQHISNISDRYHKITRDGREFWLKSPHAYARKCL